MGWYNMPSSVQETAFERMIKEGKAYQMTRVMTIPANSSMWIYIQMPENKDVVLESRNLAATVGPIVYQVYPSPTLIGTLGESLVIEKLNMKKNGPAQTQLNFITAADVDITGIERSDSHMVPATEQGGNRGNGSVTFQRFFKVYAKGTKVAVQIENRAAISSLVELNYLWAEDVE